MQSHARFNEVDAAPIRASGWGTASDRWAHGALVAAALAIAALSGLLIRIEWLTPPLDMMQARSFGALLTLHGALAFYFVFIPCGFYIPTLLALDRTRGAEPEPLPQLGALTWGLQAAGLGALLFGFFAGGSEAGWGLSNIGGAQHAMDGVGPILFAATAAGFALIAHGARVSSFAIARRQGAGGLNGMARHVLIVGSALGLMAGAALVVCMALLGAERYGGMPIFDPNMGGAPLLYEKFFTAFRQSAQTLVWFVPAGLMASSFCGHGTAPISRAWAPLLGLSLVAGLPMWGAGAAWTSAIGVLALLGIGLSVLLQASRAGALNGAHLLQGLFWVAAIQALTINLLALMPAGHSIYSQTTVSSASLHMLAYAVVGLGLPGLLSGGRALSPGASLALAIGGLAVFFGAQFALLPDVITGLHGLSFRANAYPVEMQALKVLGSAGTTLVIAGGAFLFAALLIGRGKARD
jgi:cytochrome c oxidase subunit 1